MSMENLLIEPLGQLPVRRQKLEIVERKGVGHPDYICDSIVNEIAISLGREYLRTSGRFQHFNVDKALLAAGVAENRFGGGRIVQPMKLILGDRATYGDGTRDFPVESLARMASNEWLRRNLRFVDPDEHLVIQTELKRSSAALQDIFSLSGPALPANDTSAAVGYAPMTPLEDLVLRLENHLNSPGFKRTFPETGEDVKVMGLRARDRISFTVAMAFVDRLVDSEDRYFSRKREILDEIRHFLSQEDWPEKTDVEFNTLDAPGKGIRGVYLTVLGTSADGADSGQVGRGNRPNGLICLNRPASSEAAAGKNPVSHVGKIYNILSFELARKIHGRVDGLEEVYVWLLSSIGVPVDQPRMVAVQIIPRGSSGMTAIRREVKRIVSEELDRIGDFCMDLAEGKHSVC